MMTRPNVLGIGRKGPVLECSGHPKTLLWRHPNVLFDVPGCGLVVITRNSDNSLHNPSRERFVVPAMNGELVGLLVELVGTPEDVRHPARLQ